MSACICLLGIIILMVVNRFLVRFKTALATYLRLGPLVTRNNVGTVKEGMSSSFSRLIILFSFSLPMYRLSGDFWINR